MTTTLTLDRSAGAVEITAEFAYSPGCPADYGHPGDPPDLTITAIRIGNEKLSFDCLSEAAREAIREAALEEAASYEPDYD